MLVFRSRSMEKGWQDSLNIVKARKRVDGPVVVTLLEHNENGRVRSRPEDGRECRHDRRK